MKEKKIRIQTLASRLGIGVRRFDGLRWLNSAAIGAPNITRRGVSRPMSDAGPLPPPLTPNKGPGVLTPGGAPATTPPPAAVPAPLREGEGELPAITRLPSLPAELVTSGLPREAEGDRPEEEDATPAGRARLRELRQLLRRPRADSGAG